MTGLDAGQRAALERLIIRARSILEKDLEAQAEGRYGINTDGAIEDEAALHLDPSALADRRETVAIVAHLRNEGETPAGSVRRLIREAAFTHLNRFVAIRVAEAMGLLPPSLAEGRASQGFREVLEVAPLVAGDETGGYWTYLLLCGDEMAGDAPALFDPRNPLLTLSPSVAALDELVTLLSDPSANEIWTASDTFGWAYQFFNTGDERRQMRDESPAPRNSRELAVRNQFFTPRYVVDFLVQNTLGRRLLEAQLDSALMDALPLLVDPPTQLGEPLPLDEVRILDPACGSGHFLIGCYDLLERAWQLQGVEPAAAAPRIVPTLWGIDIDPRCAQVASAAIVFRARRHCRDLPLPRPSVITARALPDGSDLRDHVLAPLPSDRRELVHRMREALAQAPLLGPLLKAEEQLAAEIRRHFTGSEAADGTLAEGIAADAFGGVESEVLDSLQRAADSASSSAAERLLAAEADDAIRFVEAIRQRYNVVLMNPPYGLAPKVVEEYLKMAYPTAWTDLYAAFLVRGLELLSPDGYMEALTSSQFFTTRRMRGIRKALVEHSRPMAIVDLGPGVLQGAAVSTAASVVPDTRPVGATCYLDLTGVAPERRGDELASNMQAQAQRVDLSEFAKVDGMPFAFHVAADQIDLWESGGRFEPSLGIVRKGGSTFDNFRFLRCRWEVSPRAIGRDWIPYQKGGDYQPYFAPSHLVVDWRGDGKHLREEGIRRGVLPQIMQSSSHWRKPGLCFPRVNKGLGVRVMPADEIFTDKAIAIFANDGVSPLRLLGLLNSTPIAALLQTFGRSRFIEAGTIKSLPLDLAQFERLGDSLDEPVALLIDVFRGHESLSETSSSFTAIPSTARLFTDLSARRLAEVEGLQERIDRVVADAMGIDAGALQPVQERSALMREVLTHSTDASNEWATRTFSYLVGCAFGRWDVRVGRDPSLAATARDLFEPVPPCPPGMLVGRDGFPVQETPPEYPIAVPPGRVLLDEPGHTWDIEERVHRAAAALVDDADAVLAEMLSILGRRSVRDYARKRSFRDHLARYSKSRRKAPIYWPLAVPSTNWGVWVYAPGLSREVLFAIAGEAARREALTAESVRRLQAERDAGGTGRSIRDVTEALAAEEGLAGELGKFKAEAERIAGLGWEPDLDDGIILCAAPLASLFPAWPDAAKERDKIREGEYPWASVSRWKDAL